MSILDDDINLDMGIINHTCKLYIKKYGVNAHLDPAQDVCDILHEYDSIDNIDKLFVYWAYTEWDGDPLPTYKLLITDIAPKTVAGQLDVLIHASILIRDDSFYRPCTNRGHLLSLSDIMNELNN
jgi:hypothetical protein